MASLIGARGVLTTAGDRHPVVPSGFGHQLTRYDRGDEQGSHHRNHQQPRIGGVDAEGHLKIRRKAADMAPTIATPISGPALVAMVSGSALSVRAVVPTRHKRAHDGINGCAHVRIRVYSHPLNNHSFADCGDGSRRPGRIMGSEALHRGFDEGSDVRTSGEQGAADVFVVRTFEEEHIPGNGPGPGCCGGGFNAVGQQSDKGANISRRAWPPNQNSQVLVLVRKPLNHTGQERGASAEIVRCRTFRNPCGHINPDMCERLQALCAKQLYGSIQDPCTSEHTPYYLCSDWVALLIAAASFSCCCCSSVLSIRKLRRTKTRAAHGP
jgi:hypothetical protein